LASFERRRPMRAGSLIVTIYGDAIVPRGGSLWLGSLLDMMAGFGVEPGLVRTAISRLVADGWFERTRIGKQSYYRLSAARAFELEAATSRIYRGAEPAWSGEFEVAILTTGDTAERAARRERMLREGYGQAAANVMVRPKAGATSDSPASLVSDAVAMVTHPQSAENARALAQACWQLNALDAAYRDFLKAFGPVADEIEAGARLADAQAFQLRTLLIHDWRRIVLRDPLLPRAMLPEDWPGFRALAVVAGIYRRALAGAERWLDGHAVNEDGPLPEPAAALAERFCTQ
ncbi:MAG TPA: phenylacetic acid degradation operon negative regulatory protein PaaX, partial [Hyphomicrobiaceae bacterium]|nr:phenylacetic acid degradation operon negative regulatory protein PaaX [Hyphomicrobiaceae bacterium]